MDFIGRLIIVSHSLNINKDQLQIW